MNKLFDIDAFNKAFVPFYESVEVIDNVSRSLMKAVVLCGTQEGNSAGSTTYTVDGDQYSVEILKTNWNLSSIPKFGTIVKTMDNKELAVQQVYDDRTHWILKCCANMMENDDR